MKLKIFKRNNSYFISENYKSYCVSLQLYMVIPDSITMFGTSLSRLFLLEDTRGNKLWTKFGDVSDKVIIDTIMTSRDIKERVEASPFWTLFPDEFTKLLHDGDLENLLKLVLPMVRKCHRMIELENL